MKSLTHFTSRIAFFLFIFLISSPAFSQKESVRYFGPNGKLTDQEHAIKILNIKTKSLKKTSIQTLILKDASWDKITTDQYKLVNDSTYLISENSADFTGKIIRRFALQPNQLYRFKDLIKGKVVRKGTAKSIMPLLFQGEVTEYYKNGNVKSVSQYNKNELVSNKNWDSNGDKYIDNIFYSVDVDPTFQPGAKIIDQRLMNAFKTSGIDITSISGSLVVGFVVMEDGTIDGVKILKGLGPNINNVVADTFVNLKGAWNPAKLNNQSVRYFQVFPINFIYKSQSLDYAELKGNTLHWGAY